MTTPKSDEDPSRSAAGADDWGRLSTEEVAGLPPNEPATAAVLFWQVRKEIATLEGKVDGLVTAIEVVTMILNQRGRFISHVASVCAIATRSLGAVTKAFVDDTVVRRMLAAAVLIGALGAGGFTWFSGSYGDASVDFGDQPQAAPQVQP